MKKRTSFSTSFLDCELYRSFLNDLPTMESTLDSESIWNPWGYSKGELGIIQSLFLAISYITPVISGTFADRYGFKKVLIISYLAYLPSIMLLIFTKSFSGIALTHVEYWIGCRNLLSL